MAPGLSPGKYCQAGLVYRASVPLQYTMTHDSCMGHHSFPFHPLAETQALLEAVKFLAMPGQKETFAIAWSKTVLGTQATLLKIIHVYFTKPPHSERC